MIKQETIGKYIDTALGVIKLKTEEERRSILGKYPDHVFEFFTLIEILNYIAPKYIEDISRADKDEEIAILTLIIAGWNCYQVAAESHNRLEEYEHSKKGYKH